MARSKRGIRVRHAANSANRDFHALILDEPSIGLAPLLVERVMASIREINATYGTAILLVEQNLKHGLAIAQRAIVLNRGAKVFDW